MNPSHQRHWASRSKVMLGAAVLGGVLLSLVASPARAYSPKSPEVKLMVSRAMNVLANATHHELGGSCLIGLVYVKDGKGESHPQVARAVKHVQAAIAGNTVDDAGSHALYSTGLACIFMAELDPVKYRREIEFLLNFIIKRQMQGGGFSYPTYLTGDVSQTQYAVLSMWTARNAGLDVPTESVERVANWLMRVQDAGGGWPYQGQEPMGQGRAKQDGVTLSLSAAGGGSLYICGDLLGAFSAAARTQSTGLPAALRLVIPEAELAKRREVRESRINAEAVKRSLADMNRFFDANFNIQNPAFQMYYMYALERYMSFREQAEGIDDPEPDWYNKGVDFLKASQKDDGTFSLNAAISAEIDAAFGVLFLTRSTKKAIEKNVVGEGTLSGGKGLKGNMANARIKDGRIIAPPEKGAVDDLASILDDPRSPDVDALAEFPDGWLSDVTPEKLARQVERLRRLVHHEKFEVRMVSIRALGRSGDYDSIPYLIYALTDPDIRAVRAANDSLRFISRRLEGTQLSEKLSDQERATLILGWKKWYKNVNPAAVFIE